MATTVRLSPHPALRIPHSAFAWLALLAAGCMDPSIYQGYGTAPQAPAPRRVAASPQPAAQAEPGKKLPFGATPPGGDPFWGVPKQGDLLARSPDNVGIVVEKLDARAMAAMDAGGAFRARSGNVTVAGGNPLAARNGLQVRVATGSFAGRIGGSVVRTRSSTREQMFIVVKSGTEGALVVGGDVYVRRLGYWGPYGYQLLIERDFVGRQLAVRPTILSDGRIAVQLWPRFSTRKGRVIDVTQLSTTVTVRDGQSLLLGGLNTAGSEISSVLFGASGRESSGTMAIVLTAKIGGLDIDWPKGR
ncbi:MAG TPA: hypothetical protein VNE39_12050 [Planctomycetota bacterium]|nr:hypothetical protein [Planctomycetota bacterium]